MGRELDNEFEKLVEKNSKQIKSVFKNFRAGMLSEDELKRDMRNIFYSYYSFMHDNGCRSWISENNWKDFLSDYQRWTKGELPDSNSENPWLTSISGISPTSAASELERVIFFKIMSFLKLPVEYYEPFHIVPALKITEYEAGNYWTIWNIVDDGGLTNDHEPIGKTFVLTDQFGLKTNIQIKSKEYIIKNKGDDQEKITCDYLGIGTIEGYTSATPVDIEVNLRSDKVFSLCTFVKNGTEAEHENVYYNFPLWQEYFNMSSRKHSFLESCKEMFFSQHYKENFEK